MIAYIVAGVVAYFVVGTAIVGVGEAILDDDTGHNRHTSNDNGNRTFIIVLWPVALVVVASFALCIGIAEACKRLNNRYGHNRYSFKQIIFSPGEAARRLACAQGA